MSTLYLVRHGQASFGSDNYDQLSTVGRRQAELLGQFFADSGETIHRIYSGSLLRQRATAQIISGELGLAAPIVIDRRLDEYDGDTILHRFAASLTPEELADCGWPELTVDRRRYQLFLERAVEAWLDARLEAQGVTTWQDFRESVTAGLRQIMHSEGRSKTLIVSTSGGVIATSIAHVLGLPSRVAFELNWAIHNASITRLRYNAQKLTLSMFNALPHLEREGLRDLITYR